MAVGEYRAEQRSQAKSWKKQPNARRGKKQILRLESSLCLEFSPARNCITSIRMEMKFTTSRSCTCRVTGTAKEGSTRNTPSGSSLRTVRFPKMSVHRSRLLSSNSKLPFRTRVHLGNHRYVPQTMESAGLQLSPSQISDRQM